MAAYEGGQYVGRPSLRPVRGFFGSSGVPPGIGRNDEEDDVDVSPFSESEIFVAANLVHVARCCCRRSSCFFSARAAFFLLLTKCCCTWCCAVVVVVAKDISLLYRVSLDVFSGEERYLSKHFTNHLIAVLREAQHKRSAEGVVLSSERQKNTKKELWSRKTRPLRKNEKENDGVLGEINRVCVLRVCSLFLSSR